MWFFLTISSAAILVQCSLTQVIKIHRTKKPMKQEGLRGVCLSDNYHGPDPVSISAFPQQAGVGRWESFRAFWDCWTRLLLSSPIKFQLWTPVPQPQAWGSVGSLLTGIAVLNVRSWVSHYQSPKPCLCLFYTLMLSAVLQSLWPHNP